MSLLIEIAAAKVNSLKKSKQHPWLKKQLKPFEDPHLKPILVKTKAQTHWKFWRKWEWTQISKTVASFFHPNFFYMIKTTTPYERNVIPKD